MAAQLYRSDARKAATATVDYRSRGLRASGYGGLLAHTDVARLRGAEDLVAIAV